MSNLNVPHILYGILFLAFGGLLSFATFTVVKMEIKSPKEALGRELNQGENIVPSPILGIIALVFLCAGGWCLFFG